GPRALEPMSLGRVAEQADGAGAEPLHGKGKIGKPVVASERFADETERADIERARRIRIDRGVHQPAVTAELRHQIARCRIDIAVVGRQMGPTPCVNLLGEEAVPVLEERPAEKALVRHQLPSKTGFSLATKARYARSKSLVCMQIACACASASIACSRLIDHSWLSCVLVMPCAKVGPEASWSASASASRSSSSAATSRLKKPQRSPSCAVIVRPVYRSSAARPWPMMRGRIAHAPMSHPASPTRV